jgi:hypothetical protein
MTKKNKQIYLNRLSSFAWRTSGLFIVTGAGFIISAGSIYGVDWKVLADVLILTTLGAITNEVTKYLNTGK